MEVKTYTVAQVNATNGILWSRTEKHTLQEAKEVCAIIYLYNKDWGHRVTFVVLEGDFSPGDGQEWREAVQYQCGSI